MFRYVGGKEYSFLTKKSSFLFITSLIFLFPPVVFIRCLVIVHFVNYANTQLIIPAYDLYTVCLPFNPAYYLYLIIHASPHLLKFYLLKTLIIT